MRENRPTRVGGCYPDNATLCSGVCFQVDRQGGIRSRIAEPVGPFHQANRFVKGGIETELENVVGAGQPVEVGMPDVYIAQRIGLNERVGRGGDIFLRHVVQAHHLTDNGAGQVAFSCANGPGKQQEITNAKMVCELLSKRVCRARISKCQAKIKAGRVIGGHARTLAFWHPPATCQCVATMRLVRRPYTPGLARQRRAAGILVQILPTGPVARVFSDCRENPTRVAWPIRGVKRQLRGEPSTR